jgi:hypothetical protein
MQKHSITTGSDDFSQVVFRVIEQTIGENQQSVSERRVGNNRIAADLRCVRGIRCGKVRTAKLSEEQRSEIAKKATATCWKKSL